MTNLTNIETFVVAARAGSFAGAARQLAVTPALVGRRIQALEQHYGARLIERTTRAQQLTELGETFLARAETVIEAAGELEELTGTAPGQLRGRVRISGPTTLGITRLAPIVARFCEAHPGVTVEMQLNDRRADLIGDGFDLAVRIGNLQPSGLIARRVGTYGFVVCAAPSFLVEHKAPQRPSELTGARCVLNLNIVPRNQWVFLGPDGGETIVAEVSGQLQIDNGEALRAAALAGAGIVYIPLELVAGDIAKGRLTPILERWQTLSLPIHVLHPSRRFLPSRVAALIEALARGLGAQ
jgi:DNA-binding transcriptional LysR family regulator